MIEIFQQEIKDNLASLMDDSISYACDIQIAKSSNYDKISEMIAKASIDCQTDETLFPTESILASVGMNLNDEVFLSDEILRAKQTPVDKPFNMMHDGDNIIGHMTASRLIDENYNEVETGFKHIAVSSVIYKVWRDPDKMAAVAQLIEEIKSGKWKVSMECMFPHFDYAIITADGEQKIIERNESTAYLSKFLRKYGGPGYYNNNKIGRVLRNLTFIGKGLVENPGNPYSIIFKNVAEFSGAVASLDEIKELVMNEELEKAIARAEKAEAEVLRLKEENIKVDVAKLNESIAQKDTIIEEQKAVIAGLQSDLTKNNGSIASLNEELTKVKADSTVVAEKLATAESALKVIEAEKIVIARKAALANAGVKPEKIDEFITKFASANDEMFNTLVSTVAEYKPTENVTTTKVETQTTETADFSQANLETNTELNVSTAEQVDEAKKAVRQHLKNILSN